ncbi:type II TA system antitoxin MqsA family protein [Corallococcus sp. AB045]|uniref:type II TA system antitoxin MqsA family protein n=1 Tax=Corallococcus sp. AB045 TaxID=2316719 RepID=UPI0013151547|nr:type II TA system antitoxin MqsA family protein [Corallococcus sp. AB045]
MAQPIEEHNFSDECPVCGSDDGVSLFIGPYSATYNRMPVELPKVERYKCSACGERFFTEPQSRELSRLVKDAVRVRSGGLSPERIASIREKLGLSQGELEDLLGLGPKVVTRWENGRVVPGRATDYLLRLMERTPGILEVLKAIRREVVQGPAEVSD